MNYPTLSIHNPWAWSIIEPSENPKDVENRCWHTLYRGELYIHTTKSKQASLHLPKVLQFTGLKLEDYDPKFQYIIGKVDLVDCITYSDSPWAVDNQYHWILENPVKFSSPIPAKGQQRIWNCQKYIEQHSVSLPEFSDRIL